ncbi:hypothetical protein LUZ60_003582 [Juncus effusus]|nr:hypothetical protein LUZ60_003582 [Juncus effusus]
MEHDATPPNPKEKGIKNQNWTKQESEFLMNFLAEEARSGRMPEKGFKSCQYNTAARALNKKYGKSFSETHIVNHMKTIKRKWKNIQIVKKLSGSSFDDDTCTVILGEEEFKTYIQTHPNYEPYINKPMPYYRDMETIYNNEMASGSRTAACNGTNSFSLVPLSSSPEEQINVIGDETEEELQEIPPGVQPVVSNRRVNNPASNGSRKRKKREEDDDNVNKQVARMVDAMEKICADKNVQYAKDLMERLEPLQGKFTNSILMALQQYFLVNKNHGYAFISYPHSMKISCVREFMTWCGYASDGTGGGFGTCGGFGGFGTGGGGGSGSNDFGGGEFGGNM